MLGEREGGGREWQERGGVPDNAEGMLCVGKSKFEILDLASGKNGCPMSGVRHNTVCAAGTEKCVSGVGCVGCTAPPDGPEDSSSKDASLGTVRYDAYTRPGASR